jgi:hypothetical protein
VQPNLVSLTHQFQAIGESTLEVVQSLRGSFNGDAPEFRSEGDRLAQSLAGESLDG